jgi:hypothetical protein
VWRKAMNEEQMDLLIELENIRLSSPWEDE